MEQLEQSSDFSENCRRLFAPEHGRRWKTAAADALAIGRTTLYRYLNGEQPVPGPVRARLAALVKRPANPYASRIFLGDEKMTPEQHIADPSRPFTGAEYIDSLKDGREVYINGERVRDVTTHPAFRNSVRSLARLYDALHEPERKEVLTCPTDTVAVSMSGAAPDTVTFSAMLPGFSFRFTAIVCAGPRSTSRV